MNGWLIPAAMARRSCGITAREPDSALCAPQVRARRYEAVVVAVLGEPIWRRYAAPSLPRFSETVIFRKILTQEGEFRSRDVEHRQWARESKRSA
jgi:hypothetical protein